MRELRDYQKKAIEEARQLISQGKKSIMIQAPTGAGKGVILSHIIHSATLKGSTVLFLVHRGEILKQISAYMKHFEIEHGIIKSGEDYNYALPVQLASFQTIIRRMDYFTAKFDLVIIDEAHHATAETYLKVINAFKTKLILGFSATPTRKNGLGLGNLFDAMVQVASIKFLTTSGFLAPIRYYAPVEPDLKGVKLKGGDYNETQLEPVMMQGELVSGIVEHWVKLGENRKTVVFATGVDHSIAVMETFAMHGIKSAHLDGKTGSDERIDILRAFRQGIIKVLVNCQILTEGVDIPDISCVILARPTKSLPMYMQMIGRGMRVVDGKKDMILLDHAGCVYEHGFVEEITNWKLSTTEKTENKKQKERDEKVARPITCPECSSVYTGRLKCPECGTIPKKEQFGKDVEYIDATLGEIRYIDKTKPPKVSMEVKQEWFSQLAAYAKQKGYKDGWASNQYRAKFGVWPNSLRAEKVLRQNPDVLSWIVSRQIAYANRRNNEKR